MSKLSETHIIKKANPELLLKKQYDSQFIAETNYLRALPDPQSGSEVNIQGASVPILQVGISGFKLPLVYLDANGDKIILETEVTGTISLGAETRGAHMSRIMRSFYEFKDRVFDLELLEEILLRLKKDLGASRAQLKLTFNYPIAQKSLRSELHGFQYYKVTLEGKTDDLDRFRKKMHFDFVYSSACPCSSELSEHARHHRDTFCVPHSQRSKARVSVEIKTGEFLSIQSMQQLCLKALQTETQVMVKREDEQAFAELNGAHMKFVEDAVRLIYEQLDSHPSIKDFQVACVHLESLHSHNAVAVINKGMPGGFTGEIGSFNDFIC